jgi:hypothetical protein
MQDECLTAGLIDIVTANGKEGVYEEAKKIALKNAVKVAHKKFGGSAYQYLKMEMYREISNVLLHGGIAYVAPFTGMKELPNAKL